MRKLEVLKEFPKKTKVRCNYCEKTFYQKNDNKKECSCGYGDNEDFHFRSLMRRYSKGAKDRNYSFNLKFEEFKHICKSECFYCGKSPSQKHGKVLYNGVDRVDNNKGYSLLNSHSCCGTCNKMKGVLEREEFIEHISRLNSNYSIRRSFVENDNKEEGMLFRIKSGAPVQKELLLKFMSLGKVKKENITSEYMIVCENFSNLLSDKIKIRR
jgi:hypothetical protein